MFEVRGSRLKKKEKHGMRRGDPPALRLADGRPGVTRDEEE
ncbi:MAG: hypothetical protein ABII93_03830 [Chrysiogenia bacterium]